VRLEALAATDDELDLWIDGPAANVLDNDTEASSPLRPLVAGQFSTVEATGTLPAGIKLSTSGWLAVGAEAAPGRWEIGYRVCQIGYADGCATAVARVTVPSQTLLTGTVAEGAWVEMLGVSTVAGRCNYATGDYDACGAFELRVDASAGRTALQIGRPGEFQVAETEARLTPDDFALELAPGRIVQVKRFWSQPVNWLVPYQGQGEIVPRGSGLEARVPGAALRWEGFTTEYGPATTPDLLMLTALQPGDEPRMLPGDYSAQIDGVVSQVEIFAAAHFESMARGYDGSQPSSRAPEAAVLSMSAASRAAVLPAAATLFRYDPASARWQARGTATRLRVDGVESYEGDVDRPGTWAAGRVVDVVGVTGCVRDVADLPVAGALVSADGLDHSSRTETRSGADGSFSLQVPRASLSRVTVRNAGATSVDIVKSTSDIGPLSAATQLADCLRADGPARLTISTSKLGQAYSGYGLSDELAVSTHAPDGSLYNGEKLSRPLVGVYRVYMARSLTTVGSLGYRTLWPAVTVAVPGQAPITVSAARPLGKPGEAPGYWWLAEVEVDASCAVSVRRRLEQIDTLPTPMIAPARYCTG
jgi:hypothetical protein